jgi:hypothetical protein
MLSFRDYLKEEKLTGFLDTREAVKQYMQDNFSLISYSFNDYEDDPDIVEVNLELTPRITFTNEHLRKTGSQYHLPFKIGEITNLVINAPKLNSTEGFPNSAGRILILDMDLHELNHDIVFNVGDLCLRGTYLITLTGIHNSCPHGVSELEFPKGLQGNVLDLARLDNLDSVSVAPHAMRLSDEIWNEQVRLAATINDYLSESRGLDLLELKATLIDNGFSKYAKI